MAKEIHERLEWARTNAGHSSPRAAAEAFGWNPNTYKSRELGFRGISDQSEVRKYARAFRVSFIWLLTGEGNPTEQAQKVQVMGFIGAGAEIMPDFEQLPPEGLFEIETMIPMPDGAIAFEVDGDSMWPRYDPGDVVICWREGTPIEEVLGYEAAVRTSDGHRYLKRVLRGSQAHTYDLESHNSAPIRGVRLEWVSGVGHVIRRGQWAGLNDAGKKRAARKATR